jgi:hypothetical protein
MFSVIEERLILAVEQLIFSRRADDVSPKRADEEARNIAMRIRTATDQ